MINLLIIFLSSLVLYFLTLSNTIYGGDAGDLVTAILAKGFPHPPGYPLYTILGRILVNINFSLSPAGKTTIISLFSTSISLVIVYLIIKILSGKTFNPFHALIAVFVIMVNYLVWLYAIVPEVFPLNILIILSLFVTALKYKKTGVSKWLFFCLFFVGLGVCHHHTFILIIPSIYFLISGQIKKTRFSLKTILLAILFFFLGLSPLIYLPIVALSKPEIIWGNIDSINGFIALISRQAYGTFVPGQFISNFPIHRFIQLANLNFFVLSDFTLIGYLMIIVGLLIIIRSKTVDKNEKVALFLAIFLFGPFFFFYANFPLRNKFDLATVERFMLALYFLLAVPYYFGLIWLYQKIIMIIKYFVRNKYPIFAQIVIILFILIPLGLAVKNYRRLATLKDSQIAEKLGRDILNDTQKNSVILLSGDTLLFNTQYVYYANKTKYKNKLVIQASKIPSDYYREALKSNYPKLVFTKQKKYGVGEFIKDNVKSVTIYSNDKYSLPANFPYKWIFQGMVFKLVSNDYDNTSETDNNILNFWNTAENKNLADYYQKSQNHWLTYFPNDILRVYATAHQNTAFYFLSINSPTRALPHIKQALVLNPEDLDSLFLLSVYYVKINDCKKAERTIIQALDKSKDKLYLFQLEQLERCYLDEADKRKIQNLIKKFSDQPLNKLVN